MRSYQNLSSGRNSIYSRQRIALDPGSVIRLMRIWRQRARMRRQLAQLDDRQLHDTGLSPIDIKREIIKPFWSE
ncbi:MAG: DUF1127 domain-containing protein [Alphaproteobacteria bacterium]|nr:DUF1127 domain-containing protein [Alphaproteobacteria bacterium]